MTQYTCLTTIYYNMQIHTGSFENPVYMMWMYKHVYNLYLYLYMDFHRNSHASVASQMHCSCFFRPGPPGASMAMKVKTLVR